MASQTTTELLGIEPVPQEMRHGTPRQLFTLWWSANLGMPAFLVGVLGPILGLNWLQTIIAVIMGNLIASLMLGATAVTGTGQGLAQLPLSRSVFGRRGNYVPAGLNFLSSLGWYVVNTAIGGGALSVLLHLPLALAIMLVAVAQGALAYLGYDVIHRFEQVMAYVQAALFLALSVAAVGFIGKVSTSHPGNYGAFLLELAAVASYSFSWSTYASDYSRYLPQNTSKTRVFWMTFWGSWLSCTWVEIVGGLAGALGLGSLSAVGIVQHLMGRFQVFAELAIVFGTLTANALNSYTSALSLLTLDLKFLRPYAAGILAVAGGVIAFLSSANFLNDYENFLLLISYWIAPWIAITLVGYWHHQRVTADNALTRGGTSWRALAAFLIGLAVTVPFMSTVLFEGPMAKFLENGDISYYLGFVVSGVVYWVIGTDARTSVPLSRADAV